MGMSNGNGKKKSKTWIIVTIAVIVVLGGSAFAVSSSMKKALAKKSEKATTYEAEQGDLAVTVVESGPLEAERTVEVKSRVSGRVAQLLVDEGDYVVKDQLIAVIDPQETELRVKQNRAQLRGAESSVARTDIEIEQRKVTAQTTYDKAQSRLRQLEIENGAQPALTKAAIASAKASADSSRESLAMLINVTHANERVQIASSLVEAESSQEAAALEHDRRLGLFEKGYNSKRDVESSKLQLDLANARLKTARDRVSTLSAEQKSEEAQARDRLRQSEADLTRANTNSIQDAIKEQQLQQAKDDLRSAEATLTDVQALMASRRQQQSSVEQIQSVLDDSLRELGETEIRSPVTGIVTVRYVQEGELVASLSSFSSGSPIVRVEDRSQLLVRLNINEIDIARLSLGTPAEIMVDAFPLQTFDGRVSKIAPAAIQQLGGGGSDPVVKYAVEVALNTSEDILKSGMSARCTMTVSEKSDVVKIRTEYLGKNKDDEPFVLKFVSKSTKPGGKPKTEEVVVVTGMVAGAYTEIIEGIEAGAELIKPKFTGPSRQGMMGVDDGSGPDEEDEEEES